MRELRLLAQVYQAYVRLGLKRLRLLSVVLMMVVAAVLEMIGLSILYPLILALGTKGTALTRILSYIPFSQHLPSDTRSQLIFLFAVVGIINLLKNVALYFTYNYNIVFATYFHRRIITGLYGAYVQKPLADCRRQSAGELTNIVCTQAGRLIDGVVRPLLVVVTEAALLVAICGVVLAVSPGFAIVVVAACGISIVSYYGLLRNKALAWGQRRMDAASLLHELVGNTVIGISEIKAFGKERYMTEKVAGAARSETAMFEKGEMHQQGPRFLLESVFVVSFIAMFIVQVASGADLTVLLAKFSVIAASSFRILPSMSRLVNSYSNFSVNIGPAQTMLDECMHAAAGPTRADPAAAASRPFAGRLIELRQIGFSHDPSTGEPLLANVNLTITQGQRIGILGPSGSGKSTLVEMIAGLQIPTSGAVLVDGRPIGPEIESWQARVGYVPQASFILPGTIRENVSFETDDPASDPAVWQSLEMVGLGHVVRALPSGLQTKIGEKGIGLSGGQRQLICLARALYRKPSVLLLDEPTAALDPDSERTVLRAIDSLAGSVTILMVSHKNHNFRDFDRICRCENRGLVEQATHLETPSPAPAHEK